MTRNVVRGVLGLLCLALIVASGARRTTATVSSSGDSTPPEIWIVSPSDGTTVSGKVKIMFYSFDLGGIDRYELYVDGELKQTLLPTARNMYFVWNSRETGSHTLICRAYDKAGNIGTSPQVNVYR